MSLVRHSTVNSDSDEFLIDLSHLIGQIVADVISNRCTILVRVSKGVSLLTLNVQFGRVIAIGNFMSAVIALAVKLKLLIINL